MYRIQKVTDHPTVDFAAEELKKYLRMMMPRAGEIPIFRTGNPENAFRLGLMADFGIAQEEHVVPELDDVICIDTDDHGGIIAGSNPRSILFAVYHYLEENGCRWLFPGVDGEYIPMQTVKGVKYRKMAKMRFRGQCNEGAEAQQNMLETIDFQAKLGMNAYMLEFDIPCYYYDTYYNHTNNPHKRPEPITPTTVLQWKRACEAEIAKRGLMFHDMGHGWTAEPFGIDTTKGWSREPVPISDEARSYIAMVNGKREPYGGIPLNSNFCMSNPVARKKVVDYIVNYASAQNNVDYLHVWLGDNHNNHCECENCQEKIPSDWYMILMNELDAALTAAKLKTHIVFIVYVDTYWPPKTERIQNPDRFTMLFAPITRSYRTSYQTEAKPEAFRPYERNRLVMPKDEAENMTYLKLWNEVFNGDQFCYEYHFWRLHYYDPGYTKIARVIADDIKGLSKWNLKGIIEDQTQRNYFPNGFPQYLYAKMLFDPELSFEEIREDYFSHAYGQDWKLVAEYLEQIGTLFDFDFLCGYRSRKEGQRLYCPEHTPQLQKIEPLVQSFLPVIDAHEIQPMRAASVSWQLLRWHAGFVTTLAKACIEMSQGNTEAGLAYWTQFISDVGAQEDLLQRYLDIRLLIQSLRLNFPANT